MALGSIHSLGLLRGSSRIWVSTPLFPKSCWPSDLPFPPQWTSEHNTCLEWILQGFDRTCNGILCYQKNQGYWVEQKQRKTSHLGEWVSPLPDNLWFLGWAGPLTSIAGQRRKIRIGKMTRPMSPFRVLGFRITNSFMKAFSGTLITTWREWREGVGRSAKPGALSLTLFTWPKFPNLILGTARTIRLWCRPSGCHEGIWGGGRKGNIH